MPNTSNLLLLVALGGFAAAASADDSIVCRNSIVRVGMAAAEVVAKCGAPKDKAVEDIPIRVRNPRSGTVAVAGSVHIERWTYDRGYGRFPAVLTFEDGTLKSIELITTQPRP